MADLPSRGGVTGTYLSGAYSVSVGYGASFGSPGAGIQRGTGADWMGPQNPIAPIAPPEVAGRQWDFPIGYNLATTPRSYEPVGFNVLRTIADGWDMVRLVIETRKDQLQRLKWTIKARDPKKEASAAARVKTATDFFNRPDGVNDWADWLRIVVEDLFVIDAPTLYCQRTRTGKLVGLHPLDGASITPKIDDWGRTPQPYVDINGKNIVPVAYVQNLKGIPAVDYSVRDLIYRPRNRRVHRAYGYSPIEQILVTINIGLMRQSFLLDYYREGNIPDSLIGVPDSWLPDQIKTFQAQWDAMYVDNLGARRRAKFVPGGLAKTFVQTKEPELKNEFDNWLATIVCYAFSVSQQAFQRMMNRATAQTAKQSAEEEGLLPIMGWAKSMIDGLLRDEFASPDLEFDWQEEKELDEAKTAEIWKNYLIVGAKTINQFRQELGDDPDPNPAADTLMVLTATGYIPIDANTIEGKKALEAALPTPVPVIAGPGGKPAAKPVAKPAAKVKKADGEPDDLAEVGKLAGAPFRELTPLDLDRPAMQAAAIRMTAAWTSILTAQRSRALHAAAILSTTAKLAKDERTPEDDPGALSDVERIGADVEAFLEQLELDLSSAQTREVRHALEDAAQDAIRRTYANAVGIALGDAPAAAAPTAVELGGDIFDKLNVRAIEWAGQHAGELVTGVNATTREAVRGAIADGLAAGERYTEIIARVSDLGAFSEARAALISETEIATANSMGALAGLFQARETGITVKKAWLVAGGLERICVRCLANAAEGAIELEMVFPSGDQSPAAHPRCRCVLLGIIQDEA